MTEFSARKLGEVLAFARVGSETMERGRTALASVFGEAEVAELIESQKQHDIAITAASTAADMAEKTLAKAEGTGSKLRSMRDMYVGDEWDNPAELMEWLGFFEGAAIVHWSLVKGAAEGMGNAEVGSLAQTGIQFHQGVFNTVNEKIAVYARNKETA